MPGRRATGGVFLWLPFFAQAKKVTRSPEGRVEALHFKKQQEHRSWIPAFAGMTSGENEQSEPARYAPNTASTGATCASRPSAPATRASLSDISTFPLAHNVA